jgi:hypothetical protein
MLSESRESAADTNRGRVERVFGVPDYWGKLAEIVHFLFLWGKHGG